jgi:hypothetical protein
MDLRLRNAIINEDLDTVLRLRREGVDFHAHDHQGRTVLHLAIMYRGHRRTILIHMLYHNIEFPTAARDNMGRYAIDYYVGGINRFFDADLRGRIRDRMQVEIRRERTFHWLRQHWFRR